MTLSNILHSDWVITYNFIQVLHMDYNRSRWRFLHGLPMLQLNDAQGFLVENGRCRSNLQQTYAIAASEDVFQYHSQKAWYFETSFVAVTDVTELNRFVGFAANAKMLTSCWQDYQMMVLDLSHLEDTTTIQCISGVSLC